jgi:hypothetical protein
VASPSYQYLGNDTVLYQSYLDDATGKMLIAEPGGGPYSMTPVDSLGWSVPPNDGRWSEEWTAILAKPVSAQPAPAVPAPAPAPSAPAPQGGE